MRLIDHRFLVVVGKGGVGRTTCTLALALALARHGRRVLVAELGGTDHLVQAAGGQGASYAPRQLAPGVDAMSLTPMDCLDDFGRRKLRVSRVVSLVLRSRVVQAFIDSVPGLHDLLQLGKLENLLNEPLPSDPKYDICILDAPATGHGATLLAAARSMREMTRAGPFAELARIIEDFLHGPGCGMVPVTLLEDLPVQETTELLRTLEQDGLRIAAVLANRRASSRLPESPSWLDVRPLLAGQIAPELVRLADDALAIQARQQSSLARLQSAAAQRPLAVLPDIGSPPIVDALASALASLMEEP